jgi:glycerol-3-phosphate dehydrogenase
MVRVWAGVRPTLYERTKYEDDLTREHAIFDHETRDRLPGLLSIAGGKLASYRLMSEEAVDVVCRKLGREAVCTTHLKPLPGAEEEIRPEEIAGKFQIPLFAASRLIDRHGCRAPEVMKLAPSHPNQRNVICDCEPVLEAEIRYAIRHEWARTLADLQRRTRLTLGPCQGTRCLFLAAQILGEELGYTPREVFAAANEFLNQKWSQKIPILDGAQLQQEELNQAIHFNVGCLDQT